MSHGLGLSARCIRPWSTLVLGFCDLDQLLQAVSMSKRGVESELIVAFEHHLRKERQM
jgi:hypothetical protein